MPVRPCRELGPTAWPRAPNSAPGREPVYSGDAMDAPDAQAFKDVMSMLASGVTVVTTLCDGAPYGLTVSAFTSVSANPPRVLVCLGNDTDTMPLIDRSRCFAVNILASRQAALGPRFAKLVPGVGDPFAALRYRAERTGAPILPDCLAWLDCRVTSVLPAGDHTVFIGDVEAAAAHEQGGEPLLYYRRGWRTLGGSALEP